MSVADAFRAGLEQVRAAFAERGFTLDGKPIEVLAAYNVFCKRCRGLEHDDRFAAQAPLFAKRCILDAYAIG